MAICDTCRIHPFSSDFHLNWLAIEESQASVYAVDWEELKKRKCVWCGFLHGEITKLLETRGNNTVGTLEGFIICLGGRKAQRTSSPNVLCSIFKLAACGYRTSDEGTEYLDQFTFASFAEVTLKVSLQEGKSETSRD